MDITLYYQERGEGTPFLFLHGNGEDSSYFKNQIDHFSREYHVFALDTRGHGRSPRGETPFTIEQFSCDLYDFMREHQCFPAVILGFSDGANIAMAFAKKHPDMVLRLILNVGNLNPRGVKRMTQLPIEVGYHIVKRFAGRSAEAKRRTELLSLMVNEPEMEAGELSRITVPTLVICGTRDMIRESHTREIAGNLPNGNLVVLEGDHFIANKCPDAFNQAVDAFLKGEA